jgi:hypothetical protein
VLEVQVAELHSYEAGIQPVGHDKHHWHHLDGSQVPILIEHSPVLHCCIRDEIYQGRVLSVHCEPQVVQSASSGLQ